MGDYQPHFEITGATDAPWLLLLNSLGTTTAMWDPQLPLLERHYRVIRTDLRGHGRSPAPPGPYALEDLVDDALAVLDAAGADRAAVMGCSIGSMTALGMGLRAPDRVEQIVCSAARADAPPPYRQMWADRIAAAESGGLGALWDGTRAVWFPPDFGAAHPAVMHAMGTAFGQVVPEAYIGCAQALRGLDYLKDFDRLNLPVLFVAGEHDPGAPPDTMRAMAEAAPQGSFALVEGAGHIVNVGAPDGFSAAIAPFLGLDR